MSNQTSDETPELYVTLSKFEAAQQAALLDSRYGIDAEFTAQTKAHGLMTEKLRTQLRENANAIFIKNSPQMKDFLQNLGLQADQITDLKETGQVLETLSSTVEKAAKVVHPLI
jgi:hypothetical protein